MATYNLDEKGGLFGMFGVKSPTKVLKAGDCVEVSHYNIFKPVKATVMAVSEDSIKIRVDEKPCELAFSSGDAIVLKFDSNQELYCISTECSSNDSQEPVEATLSVNKIAKMKDLIKEQKYLVSLSGFVKAPGIMENLPINIKNISVHGIKADCKESLMMEEIVDVTVKLDKDTKFIFKGKVVRKNKTAHSNEYGLEIYEISETNSRNLHHYINQMTYSA